MTGGPHRADDPSSLSHDPLQPRPFSTIPSCTTRTVDDLQTGCRAVEGHHGQMSACANTRTFVRTRQLRDKCLESLASSSSVNPVCSREQDGSAETAFQPHGQMSHGICRGTNVPSCPGQGCSRLQAVVAEREKLVNSYQVAVISYLPPREFLRFQRARMVRNQGNLVSLTI